ncbi:MAG: hypothetical protein KGZ79_08530 [Dethiobacter sp.]|jgi:hypothetical protein|nr:hypothetical protein [Dethiobacter sp.]
MTHSLHRQGSKENLQDDFALMCIPTLATFNEAPQKAARFLEIIKKYCPDNYGVISRGNKYTHDDVALIEALNISPAIFCVINRKDDLTSIFRELKEDDLGLSVVVNGIYEIIEECCQQAGLQPHTVNHSLGVWGSTDKLPSKETLEIITMCGHGQVGTNLVYHLLEEIKKGKISVREAAETLAKPCICGFFNTKRTESLLKQILKST